VTNERRFEMRDGRTGAPSIRARINYGVDVLIAVAFLIAGVSGIVLLLAGGGGGYRGGRNPAALREVLFLSRTAWKDLHDWSGIAMMAGVMGHLLLHARWIGCMTRNLLRRGARRPRAVESCPTEVGGGIA
jgi:hypothetical protein